MNSKYYDNGIPAPYKSDMPLNVSSGQGGCTNSGFNYGTSSKLVYDFPYIKDRTQQSIEPLFHQINPNFSTNVNGCNCTNGGSLRPSHNGIGASLPVGTNKNSAAIAQQPPIVDLESVFYNLNLKNDKSKKGNLNPVNLNKIQLYNEPICNNFLTPQNSLMEVPRQLYKEISINRFYNLNTNPQKNVYYDGAVNTRLESSDNFQTMLPYQLTDDMTFPQPTQQNFNNLPTNNYPQNNGTHVLMNNLTINNPQNPYFVDNNMVYNNGSNIRPMQKQVQQNVSDSESESGNSTDNEM